MPFRDEQELLAVARRELFTAVVGDVMDKLGLQRQFLPPYIQGLHRNTSLVGRAMPVLEADCWADGANPVTGRRFGLMLDALDNLKPDEVYLCTGGSPSYATWGELMSTRAMKLGAAGAVLDGYLRDTIGIEALGFACFSRGSYGQDQSPRGKVIDYGIAVEVGGVRVAPGDLVFGDADGVCVVPRSAEQDVIEEAIGKVRGENQVRKALEQGMSAREAFEKFGVL
jgi:regulator of RNase E activity RraA